MAVAHHVFPPYSLAIFHSSLSHLHYLRSVCTYSNAMMFNREGSQVYLMAQEMLRESENHIAHFRTMQHNMGRKDSAS